jgi:heme/copper-type cytochrome/quinol oxidase subunit 2
MKKLNFISISGITTSHQLSKMDTSDVSSSSSFVHNGVPEKTYSFGWVQFLWTDGPIEATNVLIIILQIIIGGFSVLTLLLFILVFICKFYRKKSKEKEKE